MPIFSNNSEQRTEFYKELQRREQQWWQARQRFIMLRERQIFWFGDNSLIMWLLWQLVSYVVVATVLMLLSKVLHMTLPLWQYMVVFGIQTLIFVTMFACKDRLANHLQSNIDKADLVREQALNEMVILASDSIFLIFMPMRLSLCSIFMSVMKRSYALAACNVSCKRG